MYVQGIKTVVGMDRMPTQTEKLEAIKNNEIWIYYPGSDLAGPRASGATRSAMMPLLAHEVTSSGQYHPPPPPPPPPPPCQKLDTVSHWGGAALEAKLVLNSSSSCCDCKGSTCSGWQQHWCGAVCVLFCSSMPLLNMDEACVLGCGLCCWQSACPFMGTIYMHILHAS